MLSPEAPPWSALLPGAIVAGVAYQLLETVGVLLVQRQLRHSSQLYGTVGAVLGLTFFLLLVVQFTLYGLEINVVRGPSLAARDLRIRRRVVAVTASRGVRSRRCGGW